MAITILPRRFTADHERLARFEREAQMLVALNHPNIGAIYGLQAAAGGVRALVLELVEGETLAERIQRGPVRTARMSNRLQSDSGLKESAIDSFQMAGRSSTRKDLFRRRTSGCWISRRNSRAN